jgi:hypothetical protein
MDVERIIDDIEQLPEMFEAPDIRPVNASAISAVLLLCTGNGHIQVHRDERWLPSPQLVAGCKVALNASFSQWLRFH